jgi:hypothetical protein
LELDLEEQQWLEEAPVFQENLSREIAKYEKDLENLRRECLFRGLLNEDDHAVECERSLEDGHSQSCSLCPKKQRHLETVSILEEDLLEEIL